MSNEEGIATPILSTKNDLPIELLEQLDVHILGHWCFSNVVADAAAAGNKIDTHGCEIGPMLQAPQNRLPG